MIIKKAWEKLIYLAGLRTLRGRLMALLAGSVTLMILLIAFSINIFVSDAESLSWRGRQGEAARNASQMVESFLNGIEDVLQLISYLNFDVRGQDADLLQIVLDQNPAIMELAYLDQDGRLVASVLRDQPVLANLFTIPISEWFRVARSGRSYYSRIQISASGEPYLIFSLPSQGGKVIAARIKMDVLSKVVSDIRFGEMGRVYVVDQQGQIIAHTNPQVVLESYSLAGNPEFEKIRLASRYQWYGQAENLEGQPVVLASTSIGETGWILITELPVSEAYANSRQAMWQMSFLLLIMAGVIIGVLGRMMGNLFLEPVDRLRAGAMKLGAGDLDYRITIPRMDELGEVMQALNEMAAHLKSERLALQRMNDELESRVQARTNELTQLNQALSREVTERTLAEDQARASLREKEVLLKEIHHRVKNNLQIISSLLNLQSRKIKDEQIATVLNESQNRVRSMALIHEKLYQSKNLAEINLGDYVKSLATFLARSYQGVGGVSMEVDTEEILLDLDHAVPCGLILNELISNAFKYAFPDGRQGKLSVVLKRSPEGEIVIRVQDNGIGFPEHLDFKNSPSLGLQLVNSLVEQIDGEIFLDAQNGTLFTVRFKPFP